MSQSAQRDNEQTKNGDTNPVKSMTDMRRPGGRVSAQIYQIKSSRELARERMPRSAPYRDAVCALCEKMVSLHLDVALNAMRAPTRKGAEVALARQIAMYLAHTTFSLPLTEVGLYFKRDRTTVTHACAVVENRRDNLSFEVTVSQLESLLGEVRCAVDLATLDKNGDVQFPQGNQ